MALGNKVISETKQRNENIKLAIGFGNEQNESIYSTWNTFQYVAKNLNVWADETIIGSNIKQNVNQLSNALYNLMKSTNELNNKIDVFLSNQDKLNGGNGNVSTDWKDKYRFEPRGVSGLKGAI